MNRLATSGLWGLLLATALQPAALQTKIAALHAHSPAVQSGHIGYKFVQIATGRTVAERDAKLFFTPASNTKLYTTACALERLGANYRMRTEVRTSGDWKPGQSRLTDLLLVGGGDPNLSGRPLPYRVAPPNAEEPDPALALRAIADQLYALGIREIAGDVRAAGTRYLGDEFPPGWTLDDSDYSYGAPVSALAVNDNSAALLVRPTSEGELAEVELHPAGSYFALSNQIVTVPGRESHVQFHRPRHGNEIVLTGTIGLNAEQWREDIAADDAALWAADCLRTVLRERGITVAGEARATNDIAGMTLAVHESAPLGQVIQVVNKVSQNLHAEMLLREVAVVSGQPGTLENGLKERQRFLSEAGITPEAPGFAFADGSGLARQNLTTPESTTRLLLYMWSRPERETWLASLPIGGVDGSLQKRFKHLARADRVHAKTGSLSHVNALSGYIETRTRGWLAFSLMVNSTAGHEADVRDYMDKLCALFAAL